MCCSKAARLVKTSARRQLGRRELLSDNRPRKGLLQPLPIDSAGAYCTTKGGVGAVLMADFSNSVLRHLSAHLRPSSCAPTAVTVGTAGAAGTLRSVVQRAHPRPSTAAAGDEKPLFVVFVTGAGSGIGLACAQRFDADGATVIGTDLNEDPPENFPGASFLSRIPLKFLPDFLDFCQISLMSLTFLSFLSRLSLKSLSHISPHFSQALSFSRLLSSPTYFFHHFSLLCHCSHISLSHFPRFFQAIGSARATCGTRRRSSQWCSFSTFYRQTFFVSLCFLGVCL